MISKRILLIGFVMFVGLLTSIKAQAHPHVFIDAQIKVYFDADGLKGFNIVWTFDKMFSELMLDEFDDDVDDNFNQEEQKQIYLKAFSNLKKHAYFTKIVIDNKPFDIKNIANFKAEINEGVMTYSFFIPCPIVISSTKKKVLVYTYDDSYYMDVSLSNSAVSFFNSSSYYIDYQVLEDENAAYYFDQIFPFALQLNIHKR